MLRKLWSWLLNHQRLERFPEYRLVDFTRPTPDHWAVFEGGDNYNALFRVYYKGGHLQIGDYILVGMRSGRIGRYRIFSRLPLLHSISGPSSWEIRATAIGYWDHPAWKPSSPPRPIKGLLGDGTRWVRSSEGALAHLPCGFTKPTSEFWKVLGEPKTHRGHPGSPLKESNPAIGPNL